MQFSTSRLALAALLALATVGAQAADWSDTSIGYRYGSKFAEPFGENTIHKSIIDLNHVSGYSYGTNFFNADFLVSDKSDPSSPGSSNGATEVYIVYRHTLDLSKVSGSKLSWGVIRNLGLTAGFDVNVKDDAGYNSRKRMLVAGPTMMFDVPGFLNVSLLELWESNAPYNEFTRSGVSRYSYDAHPMLTAAWSIPLIKGVPLTFEGFANFIAGKGKNEFGGETAPETNIDAQIMYDAGTLMGAPGKFKVGFEYQYWKNKFGNSYKGAAGDGAFAKTPMIRAEYHF
ncbi:outer envelope protein [Ideonella azotifigens]|uniref:Outer envelope protein n=1 Tax=Ideonella azotifigens TaxID=513160 RepID=A0ABN1K7Q9_9BURK|nr:outer envelope protein [Ideonella azotifigens]MCD2342358.1 outer envelope protein [Ideonella azotifigens]